jgi:hypothetical protein
MHSADAHHRGRTPKCAIRDHKVAYDFAVTVPIRMTIDKNQQLLEQYIHFEVIQEYGGGGRAERITLGTVKLNLAEYVEASEQLISAGSASGEEIEGVTRRYLMQQSKINSTLKVKLAFLPFLQKDHHATK